MPIHGIYEKNNNKITKTITNKEKVFNYLVQNKRGATQTDIAKEIGISQSAVSKIIADIRKNIDTYGNSRYILIKESGVYKIVRYKNLSIGLKKIATELQKEEFEECFENTVYTIKESNMFTGISAQKITHNCVLFDINAKYQKQLTSLLKILYNENIYDFILHENSLYIVLQKDRKDLSIICDNLCELYTKVVN